MRGAAPCTGGTLIVTMPLARFDRSGKRRTASAGPVNGASSRHQVAALLALSVCVAAIILMSTGPARAATVATTSSSSSADAAPVVGLAAPAGAASADDDDDVVATVAARAGPVLIRWSRRHTRQGQQRGHLMTATRPVHRPGAAVRRLPERSNLAKGMVTISVPPLHGAHRARPILLRNRPNKNGQPILRAFRGLRTALITARIERQHPH